MESTIVSVKKMVVKDRESGKDRTMYQCFIVDDTGGVGSLYSQHEHTAGEVVELRVAASRDGKLAVRIAE